MDISFRDQVAIVTGAGRGLGRQYALELARRGAAVVVADFGRDSETGESWADRVVLEIEASGGQAIAATHSVAEAAGGDAIVQTAIDAFGRVDVFIHNAGFLRPNYFEDLNVAGVRDILDVHLMGAFHVGQPAWKIMKRQGYGRIVLTSSSAVFGYHASANYAAAKAAILGLTTALAVEGEDHDILVNAILPHAQSDIVKDNPIPGSRLKAMRESLEANRDRWQPNYVSPIVAYLASSACSVTGQAYSAVLGRYSRVTLAIADGWMADAEIPTAEDIRFHMPVISAMDRATYPLNMIDEAIGVLDKLRDRTGR
ncbi:MAG TPA: SDR family NAD(P)-dependent oxidoreductase [Sphingobium sp.]|uniref:SDR family NAD(P)-dependent oxidoreductase n=1 Tax=Sphingobium sp. TaxID=1912891 RepID=UPI002ED5CBD7